MSWFSPWARKSSVWLAEYESDSFFPAYVPAWLERCCSDRCCRLVSVLDTPELISASLAVRFLLAPDFGVMAVAFLSSTSINRCMNLTRLGLGSIRRCCGIRVSRLEKLLIHVLGSNWRNLIGKVSQYRPFSLRTSFYFHDRQDVLPTNAISSGGNGLGWSGSGGTLLRGHLQGLANELRDLQTPRSPDIAEVAGSGERHENNTRFEEEFLWIAVGCHVLIQWHKYDVIFELG